MSKIDHKVVSHVSNAVYWLLAIEYQSERVLKAVNTSGPTNSPFRTISRMEEHFFLVGCNKARRWLLQLDDLLITQASLDAFMQHAKQAQTVRNKREHDDEYYGSSPKPEPMNKVNSSSKIDLTVSTSVTVRSGGRILLGGILDVEECVKSAALVRKELQHIQRNYWENELNMTGDLLESYCSPDRLIDK